MNDLLVIAVAVIAAPVGWALAIFGPRLYPLFPRNTPVVFDGDITGLYRRRAWWAIYHKVYVTGPAWYTSGVGREITINAKRDGLTRRENADAREAVQA